LFVFLSGGRRKDASLRCKYIKVINVCFDWQILWGMDVMRLLADAVKQHSLERGNIWWSKMKQESENLGTGHI
jgi:hypothetical protein